MTKQSMILGALALVISGIVLAPQALAYKGDPGVKGPNYTEARHEAMEKAFETGNYTAWKTQMADRAGRRVTEVINAQNFSKFAKAHELAEQGKTTEANALRDELGLDQGSGRGNGQGTGRGLYLNK